MPITLTDAATGVAEDACSPGGLAALTGSGLISGVSAKAVSFPLPSQLAGVQVNINGEPAPLLFASESRVVFQCPALDPGSPLEISLTGSGVSGAQVETVMQEAVPGIFMLDETGRGMVTISSSGQFATLENSTAAGRPAHPGESITVYASGLGKTSMTMAPGLPAPSGQPAPIEGTLKVIVGGTELDPSFAGLAPNAVGVFQVNVALPDEVSTGAAIPVYLRLLFSDGITAVSNTVAMAIEAAPVTAERGSH